MTARLALMLGAIAMFMAVALGAFGAHALKARLAPDMAAVWQTAVQYHAWHALALLAVGILLAQDADRAGLTLAAFLFAAGIVLFSGSLYVMALTGVRGLGAVTPVGGVAWLAGWAALAWAAFKSP
jgi:uncharacterized membrane protein YgdD (TMEM256/DUF423 family)